MKTYQVIMMVATNVTLIAAAFSLGVLKERTGWNKLIQRGVIPAPRK